MILSLLSAHRDILKNINRGNKKYIQSHITEHACKGERKKNPLNAAVEIVQHFKCFSQGLILIRTAKNPAPSLADVIDTADEGVLHDDGSEDDESVEHEQSVGVDHLKSVPAVEFRPSASQHLPVSTLNNTQSQSFQTNTQTFYILLSLKHFNKIFLLYQNKCVSSFGGQSILWFYK